MLTNEDIERIAKTDVITKSVVIGNGVHKFECGCGCSFTGTIQEITDAYIGHLASMNKEIQK